MKEINQVLQTNNADFINLPEIAKFSNKLPILSKTEIKNQYLVTYIENEYKHKNFTFINYKGKFLMRLRNFYLKFKYFLTSNFISFGKFYYNVLNIENNSAKDNLLSKKEIVFNYVWKKEINGIKMDKTYEIEKKCFKVSKPNYMNSIA